ncbi:hypothetical protein [Bacillus sp. FJAT-29814]|uniref:hypothetical protein n=1 Tax=Bacillus sp. FJAT-29814 TaxID=1729688 RepID=UPI00082F9B75|nr:hypothetical protein [Bacillus sp. FJAT-29814]
MELQEEIRRAIWLSRISFKADDPGYEDKLLTWRKLRNHFFRTRRLVMLGAPKIIILVEFEWLLTMVDHMIQRYHGGNPQFTKD